MTQLSVSGAQLHSQFLRWPYMSERQRACLLEKSVIGENGMTLDGLRKEMEHQLMSHDLGKTDDPWLAQMNGDDARARKTHYQLYRVLVTLVQRRERYEVCLAELETRRTLSLACPSAAGAVAGPSVQSAHATLKGARRRNEDASGYFHCDGYACNWVNDGHGGPDVAERFSSTFKSLSRNEIEKLKVDATF